MLRRLRGGVTDTDSRLVARRGGVTDRDRDLVKLRPRFSFMPRGGVGETERLRSRARVRDGVLERERDLEYEEPVYEE